jgi:hypothetical protein
MNPLAKLLSSPIGDLINSVGGVIDKFVTTDAEKLEAQRKLMELERNFQVQIAQIDANNAKTASEVIIAETKSESWAARNWRPVTMLTFTYIIAHNYVFAPLFGLPALPIPPDLWKLLDIGMGGYVFGRSAEKIVPQVTDAIIASKKQ